MLGHSPGPTPGSCTRRGSRRAQGGLAGRAGLLHAGLPKDRAGPRPFTLGTPTVGGWSSPLSARARSRPRPAASLQAGRSDPGRPHPGGGQPARGPVPSGGLESGRGAGADTGPAQASCSAAPAGPARVPAHPRALTHLCGPTGRAWPTQRGSGSLPEASCRGWVGTRARQGLRPRLGSGRAALGQGAGSWHSYKRPPPRPPKKPGASAGRGPLRQGRHARVRGQSTEGLRGHQQHLSCPPLASALPWGRRPCPQPLAAWGAGCGATSPAFSTTPPSPRSGGRSLGHRHPPTPGNPLGGGARSGSDHLTSRTKPPLHGTGHQDNALFRPLPTSEGVPRHRCSSRLGTRRVAQAGRTATQRGRLGLRSGGAGSRPRSHPRPLSSPSGVRPGRA